MKIRAIIAAAAIAIAVSGCGITDQGPKQTTGQVIGSVAGGVAGYFAADALGGSDGTNAAATAIGALAGAQVGGGIGQSLDRMDRMYIQQAKREVLPARTGASIRWKNPESGNRGVIQTTNHGVDTATNRVCKRYSHEVMIAGDRQIMTGQACKNADGTWSEV